MKKRAFNKIRRLSPGRIVSGGKRVGMGGAALLLLTSLSLGLFPPSAASAATGNLSSTSIKLSSSADGATGVTYHTGFTTTSALSLLIVVIDFCSNSPIVGDSCTAPTGLTVGSSPTVSNVKLNGAADAGAWSTASLNSGRTLEMTRSSAVALSANETVSFDLTGVVNPSATGTFYGRVLLYSSGQTVGTLGAWTATSSLPATTDLATSVTYNGYVYEIGGDNSSTATATVTYAPINSNGTLGSWTAATSLPSATNQASSVAYNGYVYEIGGSGTSPPLLSTVDYAPINANGSLGSWTATSSLPARTAVSSSVVYNGYVYEIGGYSGGPTPTVDYAQINADGTLGAWTSTTSLPVGEDGTAVAYNGYMYEIGGYIPGNPTATVSYAPINSNGTLGTWTATTSLPVANWAATSIVYNGYVYEIGGDTSGGVTATVDYAPINANGTLGAWTTTTSLPTATDSATSVIYNGYVYEIGGDDPSTSATVDYAPINDNAANYSDTSPGAYVASGGVALSTIASEIEITALVMPTITFCVSEAIPGPSCGNTGQVVTSPDIAIGHGTNDTLDSSAVDTSSVYSQLSTNAVDGAGITAKSSNNCGGLSDDGGSSCGIPATNSGSATPALMTAGTAGFGLLVENGSGGTGTITANSTYNDGTHTTCNSTGYFAMDTTTSGGNNIVGTYGNEVASSTAPVSSVSNQYCFAATASNTTPAGVYLDDITLVATGTF